MSVLAEFPYEMPHNATPFLPMQPPFPFPMYPSCDEESQFNVSSASSSPSHSVSCTRLCGDCALYPMECGSGSPPSALNDSVSSCGSFSGQPTHYVHDPYGTAPMHQQPPPVPPPCFLPPAVVPVEQQQQQQQHHQPATLTSKVALEFKHGRCEVFAFVHPEGGEPCLGEYYIAQGDRGDDLGKVVAIRALDSSEGRKGLNRLVRPARPAEVHYWDTELSKSEEDTLAQINSLVKNAGLDLNVTHASYQFDKKKLTFYYTSPVPQPDFRAILSDCYSIWKCRIWFTNLPRTWSSARSLLNSM